MRRISDTRVVVLPSMGALLLARSGVPIGDVSPGSLVLDLRPDSGGAEALPDGRWYHPAVVCVDDPGGTIADDAVVYGAAPIALAAGDLTDIRAAALAEVPRLESLRGVVTVSTRRWDVSRTSGGRERYDTLSYVDTWPRTITDYDGGVSVVNNRSQYDALMKPVFTAAVLLDADADAAAVAIRAASTPAQVVSALLAYRGA